MAQFHHCTLSSSAGEDKENQKRRLQVNCTGGSTATKRRRFRFSSPIAPSATIDSSEPISSDLSTSIRVPHTSQSQHDSGRALASHDRRSSNDASIKTDVSSQRHSSLKGFHTTVPAGAGIISAGPTKTRRLPTTPITTTATTDNCSQGRATSCGPLSRIVGKRDGDVELEGAPGADPSFPASSSISLSSGREITTLWVGNLPQESYVDETLLNHMFFEFLSAVKTSKVVRDRETGFPVGYGFVEFINRSNAEYCLRVLNNLWVPNCAWKYKLNWATFNVSDASLVGSRAGGSSTNSGSSRRSDENSSASATGSNRCGDNRPFRASIWVGSLDPEVLQDDLQQVFEERYQSIASVRVIIDPATGKCRGYGFVHFTDGEEAERALGEMNGALCRGRPLKVNRSNTSRDNSRFQGGGSGGGSGTGLCAVGITGRGGPMDRYAESAIRKLYSATQMAAEELASISRTSSLSATLRKRRQEEAVGVEQTGTDNSKVYVSGLDGYITDEILAKHFSPFGTVVSVSVQAVRGKGCVTFARESSAINAEHLMNTAQIGSRRIRARRGTGSSAEEAEMAFMGNGSNDGGSNRLCSQQCPSDSTGCHWGYATAYSNIANVVSGYGICQSYGQGVATQGTSNSWSDYYYADSTSHHYYPSSFLASGWYGMNAEEGATYTYGFSDVMMESTWGTDATMEFMQVGESALVEREEDNIILEEYDYAGKGMDIAKLNAMYIRKQPSPMLDLLSISTLSSTPGISPSLSIPSPSENYQGPRSFLETSPADKGDVSSGCGHSDVSYLWNDKKEDVEGLRRLSISSTSTTTSFLSDAAEAACRLYRLEFDIV